MWQDNLGCGPNEAIISVGHDIRMHLQVDYRQRLSFASEHLVPVMVCTIRVHARINANRFYTVGLALDGLRAAMAGNVAENALTYAHGHV